jgi:hypothetical protein
MAPKETDQSSKETARLSDSSRIVRRSIVDARADITVSAINALLRAGDYHGDNPHLDEGTGHGDGSHYDLHLDVEHWDHGDGGDFRRPWEDVVQQELAEIIVASRLFTRFEQRLERMEALAGLKAASTAFSSKEFFRHFQGRVESLRKSVPTIPQGKGS